MKIKYYLTQQKKIMAKKSTNQNLTKTKNKLIKINPKRQQQKSMQIYNFLGAEAN